MQPEVNPFASPLWLPDVGYYGANPHASTEEQRPGGEAAALAFTDNMYVTVLCGSGDASSVGT
jgi:hypothetical protein